MNTINNISTRTFLYLLPFVVLLVFSENYGMISKLLDHSQITNFLGVVVGLWIISGFWFFGSLVFNKAFRESALAKLAGISERDEREEQIVGRASKQTFLFMLAVLLVLFAVSTFRYGERTTNPNEKSAHSITLGHWGISEHHPDITTQFDGKKTTQVLLYELLPISKTGLLLFLIILHLVVYQLSAERTLINKKTLVVSIGFLILLVVTATTVKPEYISWSTFPTLLAKAENGDAESQNKIGEMFLFGDGVKQDFSVAMQWFLKSSAQGNAVAPNHLGRLYLNGEGITRDPKEACKWYLISAKRGDAAGLINAKKCPAK